MVVILLAFQVNNWIEEWKTSNVELVVLQGNQNDLMINSTTVDRVLMAGKRKLTNFQMADLK
nr:hypothetical protein [Aestuariivivens sediminis]